MSELHWILLAVGVVLMVGIYFHTRRSQSKSTSRKDLRREPSFDMFASDSDEVPQPRGVDIESDVSAPDRPLYEQADLELPDELLPEPQDLAVHRSAADNEAERDHEKVVVVHVSARDGKRFAGPAIIDALKAEALEFGEFDIFHRRSGGQSTYKVASMVEPGVFDMDNIDKLSTPGLSFFLVLPGPDSPVAAFTEMLSTARRVATALGGDVLDESGSTLSRQAASHLREQIIEFAHRIR